MSIGSRYQKTKTTSSFPRRRESGFFAEIDSRLRGNDEVFFTRLPSPISRLASPHPSPLTPHHQHGFSLVELIIGMVMMSIALVTLTTVLYPQFVSGLDPVFQMRAAELGQSLADEILAKAFDETTPVGGQPPCNVCSAAMGNDGENRAAYDDVDDYNDYCAAPVAVVDVNNNALADFANYRMQVCVDYDGDYNGVTDNNIQAKLIRINIFPPAGGQPQVTDPIEFRVYRSNF